MLLKHLVGAGDSHVIGDATKVGEDLFFADIDSFENDGAALHVHIQKDGVPMIIAHIFLHYFEGAAFIEVSEKTPTELHVLSEVSFNHGEAQGGAIDPQFAGHRVVDHEFARGWGVMRIRGEGKPREFSIHAVISEYERIRNGAEKLFGFLLILLCSMLTLGALSGIVDKFLHPLFIFAALLRGEGLAIDEESPGQRTFFSFNYVAVLGRNFIFLVQAIPPQGMVFAFSIQFVLDHLANKLIGIRGERGIGGGRVLCVRTGADDRCYQKQQSTPQMSGEHKAILLELKFQQQVAFYHFQPFAAGEQ